MADQSDSDVTTLTADLVAAFVSNNTVRIDDVPALITSVHAALAGLGSTPGLAAAATVSVPAVSTRKSLASREHIVSMIDGKPYKTLKRHLSGHGLTPEGYRARYNLPASYPMVAPAYSERRREVAMKLGLGHKRGPRRKTKS